MHAPLTTLTRGLFGIKTINSFYSNSFFIFWRRYGDSPNPPTKNINLG
jgi:hypothetical protein